VNYFLWWDVSQATDYSISVQISIHNYSDQGATSGIFTALGLGQFLKFCGISGLGSELHYFAIACSLINIFLLLNSQSYLQ